MSLPKRAKKVFTGKIFEVYQWEQKMFDGSFEIFEKIKRNDTVIALPVYKGKIIVCKQRQPHRKNYYYSLIGGRVDPGEKPLAAIKRELLEETGMKAKRVFPWKVYRPFQKLLWTTYIYIAHGCEIVAKPNWDSGEKIRLLYLTFDELTGMIGDGVFQFPHLENDIFRMEKNGTLKDFKKLLFS